MAKILGDSRNLSLPDLERKIQDVLLVVPGRSSEDASVALHDNDFDIEKAISALLDGDMGFGTVSLGTRHQAWGGIVQPSWEIRGHLRPAVWWCLSGCWKTGLSWAAWEHVLW